ncbi:MAG: hypothetical protein DI626_08260, partial [Micavibrio aeruginosavorus]
INGNVGKNSAITAFQPIATHTEKETGPGYCFKFGMDGFRYRFSLYCQHEKEFNDGLQFNDPDPAISVSGSVAESSSLNSNGTIEVGGKAVKPRIHVVGQGISLKM